MKMSEYRPAPENRADTRVRNIYEEGLVPSSEPLQKTEPAGCCVLQRGPDGEIGFRRVRPFKRPDDHLGGVAG